VEFEHFGCDVKHWERIHWTIWKKWQERGRTAFQRLNWRNNETKIFLYVDVNWWGLNQLHIVRWLVLRQPNIISAAENCAVCNNRLSEWEQLSYILLPLSKPGYVVVLYIIGRVWRSTKGTTERWRLILVISSVVSVKCECTKRDCGGTTSPSVCVYLFQRGSLGMIK